MRSLPPFAFWVCIGCAGAASIVPAPAYAQARPTQRRVVIVAQPLASALQAVARLFSIELIFASADMAGRQSRTIDGRFTAEQALARLLADSGLAFSRTGDGGYVVSKAAPPAVPVGEAVPEILVVGRRTQNADIRRSENDVQPYQVVTRRDVQRSHAATVEELVGKRLSADGQAARLVQTPTAGMGFARSSIDLRGAGTNQTLVLVDGRRLPRLPVGSGGSAFLQSDVNGLSPETLERVEIITSTAGGIYGPGATAGVVNLVLRRDYRGAAFSTTRGITQRGDAAYRRFDGRLGFTPDDGRTDVMVAFGTSRSDGLTVGDREYQGRSRALQIANNPDIIGISSSVPASNSINVASADAANLVLKPAFGGTALDTRFTTIAPADGRSPASLADALRAGAGSLDVTPGAGAGQSLTTTQVTTSILANIRHRFGDDIELYADVLRLENEGRVVEPTYSTIALQADDARNPFEQAVMVTVPVGTLTGSLRSKTITTRATAGLLASLPGGWKVMADYSVGSGKARSHERITGTDGLSSLFGGRVDPFGDSSALNAALTARSGVGSAVYEQTNRFHDAAVRLAGPVARLPGGPLTATLLVEDRREHVPERSTAIDLGSVQRLVLPELGENVRSYYGELLAPVTTDLAAFPLLRRLEIQLAVRRDSARVRAPNTVDSRNDNADPTEVRRTATTYTVGLRATPLRGVMVRGSIATGELPIAAEQIRTVVDSAYFTSLFRDPRRGGEFVGATTPYDLLSAGSGDIAPERSRSVSIGMVLTPIHEAGLRLSVDYTRIEKRNVIVDTYSRDARYFLANEAVFPNRVTRAPLTAADLASGYAVGAVTRIDTTYLNVGRTMIDAVDVKADYIIEIEHLGSIDLHSAVSWQPRYRRLLAPGLRSADLVSRADGALEWRGNGSIGWTSGRFGAVLTGQYYGGYRLTRGVYTADNQRFAADQGTDRIRAQASLDLALDYRVAGLGSAGRTLDFRFGVQDLLDRRAPIVTSTEGGYSYYADPRRRRFDLTVATAF